MSVVYYWGYQDNFKAAYFCFFYEKILGAQKAPKRKTNNFYLFRSFWCAQKIVAFVGFCLLIFVLLVDFCLIAFLCAQNLFVNLFGLEIVLITLNTILLSQVNNTAVIMFLKDSLFKPLVIILIEDICMLSKTPSDGTCLGEPPGGFCDVACCFCFMSREVFPFPETFPCHQHSTLASQVCKGLHQLWALPWLLLVALLLPSFSDTVLLRVQRFFSVRFLPKGVFYFALLPTFWHVLWVGTRAGTPHPGSSSVPALTNLSLPSDASTWTTHIVDTRALVY